MRETKNVQRWNTLLDPRHARPGTLRSLYLDLRTRRGFSQIRATVYLNGLGAKKGMSISMRTLMRHFEDDVRRIVNADNS